MRDYSLLFLSFFMVACGAGSEAMVVQTTAESVEVDDSLVAPSDDAQVAQASPPIEPIEAHVASPVPAHFSWVEPATLPAPSSRTVNAASTFPSAQRLISPRRVPLRAFRTVQELRRFARTGQASRRTRGSVGNVSSMGMGGLSTRSANTPVSATSTTSSNAGSQITNTQITGIDEGDIIKAVGEHFVILRRGVLFSVSVHGAPVVQDQMHVQPPDQGEGWIDELLVHQGTRTLIVTGFVTGPDDREYTLYHLFTLQDDGNIVRGDAVFFPSYDYFDDENYATRMVGDELVAYSMHQLLGGTQLYPDDFEGLDASEAEAMRREARFDYYLPQVRRGTNGRFERTWSPRRIFREQGRRASTLHAITSCRMNRAPIRCQTRGVLADGEGRLFVSPTAAYLWMNEMDYIPEDLDDEESDYDAAEFSASALYRFPHRRATVQSVAVAGETLGALSFQENEDSLQALVYVGDVRPEESDDEALEVADDDDEVEAELALLTIPLRSFGRPLRWSDYRPLPGTHSTSVRFVGAHHLLYGDESTFVHDLESAQSVVFDDVTPGRIDPLGSRAALISWNESDSLHYAVIDVLDPSRARERRALSGANSSETRTHGFFYQPDSHGGSFGMPVVSSAGSSTLAHVAYFDVRDLRTRLVGGLRSAELEEAGCENSCVDWYGNARPVFWRGRVFALLGSELVEGARVDGGIEERGRVVLVAEPAADTSNDHPGE